MAIKTNNAKELNKAIVDKVEKILSNMDHGTSLYINIHASFDEIPSIYYRIEENIVPDDYIEPGIAKCEGE